MCLLLLNPEAQCEQSVPNSFFCHSQVVLRFQALPLQPRLSQVKLPQGNFLWELIHPQVIKGQPANSQTGKYHVKCFVMDQWRQVTVDDRIPVDAFGSPVLVGSMPLQLWPLLLSKAVLKLMSLYQVCHCMSKCALYDVSMLASGQLSTYMPLVWALLLCWRVLVCLSL